MAHCSYWNVNYVTFQWYTVGLLNKYTKNVNIKHLAHLDRKQNTGNKHAACNSNDAPFLNNNNSKFLKVYNL